MIVEDDITIRTQLAEELKKWQYDVFAVENFDHVLNDFEAEHPDLILMDIKLPTFNGYHWCQEIRNVSNVPIIFISSQTDSMNQVMAIQMGGDDFISKPFDMTVAISKVQAMLRRTYDFNVQQTVLSVDEVKLYIDAAKLEYEEGAIDLTHTELQILLALFQKKSQFVSRNEIIEKCWESEQFIDDNTLAVNMTRLRKKLDSIGLAQFIVTKKNVGYKVGE